MQRMSAEYKELPFVKHVKVIYWVYNPFTEFCSKSATIDDWYWSDKLELKIALNFYWNSYIQIAEIDFIDSYTVFPLVSNRSQISTVPSTLRLE